MGNERKWKQRKWGGVSLPQFISRRSKRGKILAQVRTVGSIML